MINKDNFLSQIFHKNCGHANLKDIKDKTELDLFTFVFSKSYYSQIMSIKAKDLNFYLAEISINFVIQRKNLNFSEFNGCFASNSNIENIQNLAYDSFVFDRFHKDPNIPNKIASEIKKQWVKNFFLGKRGHKCFVKKTYEGKVIGFLLSNISNQLLKIDLIAIDKKYRGKGLGKSLISDFFNFYKDRNEDFYVSTQIDNFNSIRLYKSVGFKKLSEQMVWHYFNENNVF